MEAERDEVKRLSNFLKRERSEMMLMLLMMKAEVAEISNRILQEEAVETQLTRKSPRSVLAMRHPACEKQQALQQMEIEQTEQTKEQWSMLEMFGQRAANKRQRRHAQGL